jgi:hypothetical protein
MNEMTCAVPATLSFLVPWLRAYASDHPPEEIRHWEVDAGSVHNWFHQGVKRQEVQFRGARSGDVDLPLVEVWVEERQNACAITLRCNDSSVAAWFETLLEAIAERWPETRGLAQQPGAASPPAADRAAHPQDAERRERLHRLWSEGRTRQEAAADLDVSESTIKRMSRQMGLDWQRSRGRR